MRYGLVLAAVAALVASPNTASATQTGLWGVVRRGPITPVCVESRPCDEPAANVTIIFARNGREAARVTTRRDGFYRINLRPGVYNVRTRAKPKVGSGLEPSRVGVPRRQRVRVNFFIDTGIR
jgi:hypothetical protein